MTKFIQCENGSYINISLIRQVYAENSRVLAESDKLEWILASEFESEEEAQEWLDQFITEYGLCCD